MSGSKRDWQRIGFGVTLMPFFWEWIWNARHRDGSLRFVIGPLGFAFKLPYRSTNA